MLKTDGANAIRPYGLWAPGYRGTKKFLRPQVESTPLPA